MVKTTTPVTHDPSAAQHKRAKKVREIAPDFGPSDLSISNILNYSKALKVVHLASTATLFEVLN